MVYGAGVCSGAEDNPRDGSGLAWWCGRHFIVTKLGAFNKSKVPQRGFVEVVISSEVGARHGR